MGPPFVRSHLWYFLSPLDGASVREAHCALSPLNGALKRLWYFLSPLDGASVREAHCALSPLDGASVRHPLDGASIR